METYQKEKVKNTQENSQQKDQSRFFLGQCGFDEMEGRKQGSQDTENGKSSNTTYAFTALLQKGNKLGIQKNFEQEKVKMIDMFFKIESSQ